MLGSNRKDGTLPLGKQQVSIKHAAGLFTLKAMGPARVFNPKNVD